MYAYLLFYYASQLNLYLGLDNIAVETGPHAHVFADRIGKTHYLGLRVPPGDMWQAKEAILQNIIKQAQETLQSYRDPTIGPPDPSFVLQLTDDVYTGSNLYAIQKSFDGEFSFDVFYESGSSKQKLSCKSCIIYCNLMYKCVKQLQPLMRAFRHLWNRMISASRAHSPSLPRTTLPRPNH